MLKIVVICRFSNDECTHVVINYAQFKLFSITFNAVFRITLVLLLIYYLCRGNVFTCFLSVCSLDTQKIMNGF